MIWYVHKLQFLQTSFLVRPYEARPCILLMCILSFLPPELIDGERPGDAHCFHTVGGGPGTPHKSRQKFPRPLPFFTFRFGGISPGADQDIFTKYGICVENGVVGV